MDLSKDSRLAPRPLVEFRPVDQGGMLIDLDSGSCFRLNPVGAVLWARLAAGETVGGAIDAVRNRYDVSADVAEADALRLCGELVAMGLVDDVAGGDPS